MYILIKCDKKKKHSFKFNKRRLVSIFSYIKRMRSQWLPLQVVTLGGEWPRCHSLKLNVMFYKEYPGHQGLTYDPKPDIKIYQFLNLLERMVFTIDKKKTDIMSDLKKVAVIT